LVLSEGIFMKITLVRVLICLSMLWAPIGAHADSTTVLFTRLLSGQGAVPGGELKLDLRDDGTIAAVLTSYKGSIMLFGFNPAADPFVGDFSDPAAFHASIGASVGLFRSGFAIFGDTTSQAISFSIGVAGDFNSVHELIDPSAAFDYVFSAKDFGSSGIASNYLTGVAPPAIPEPSQIVLLAVGLVTLLLGLRRSGVNFVRSHG
jgi:hypothetical protein